MRTLIKTVMVAAPALMLVVYLWGGKSAQYEAQIAEDSAAVDRDFARINQAVEKDPKLKAAWKSEAIAAQQRYSSARVDVARTKKKSDRDIDELQQAVKDMDKK